MFMKAEALPSHFALLAGWLAGWLADGTQAPENHLANFSSGMRLLNKLIQAVQIDTHYHASDADTVVPRTGVLVEGILTATDCPLFFSCIEFSLMLVSL